MENGWFEMLRRVFHGSRNRMRGVELLLVGFLIFTLAGCASSRFSEKHGKVYQQAVQASQNDKPAMAAAAAYHYLQGATVDDPKYDRALRVMARNAERLGLSYAASLWFLDIARSRRNVELVDDAVAGLERIIKEYPYDRRTILDGFLATADISGLAPAQQAFVSFEQGTDSFQRGLQKWGLDSFKQIPENNAYRLRAKYVLAARRLARYELNKGRKSLEELLDEDLPRDLETKVHRTLARTEFEVQNYERALEHYRAIQDRAPEHPRLLLEMAWSHYYLGHYKRALGLLIALDAPVYRELIAPRRYLLEALALRKICQFGPARKAAIRLEQRHGDALDDLYRGMPLDRSKSLRQAAGLRAGGRAIAEFRDRIEAEQKMLDKFAKKLGPKLTKRLRAIYEQGVSEARRRENEQLQDEMQQLAQELLSAEEGVRLILHELGVALLRGQRGSTLTEGGNPIESIGPRKRIIYRFNGEFWTDELDDLVVRMEDRCIE